MCWLDYLGSNLIYWVFLTSTRYPTLRLYFCININSHMLISICWEIISILWHPHPPHLQKFWSVYLLPSSMQEGFAFAHCTECRTKFILRANVPPDRWWLRIKFQFLVARDHAVIFVIVQLVGNTLLLYRNFTRTSLTLRIMFVEVVESNYLCC